MLNLFLQCTLISRSGGSAKSESYFGPVPFVVAPARAAVPDRRSQPGGDDRQSDVPVVRDGDPALWVKPGFVRPSRVAAAYPVRDNLRGTRTYVNKINGKDKSTKKTDQCLRAAA
jgi:hypothetical protein